MRSALIAGVVVVCGVATGCGQTNPGVGRPGSAAAAGKKVYTRKAFEDAVYGRTLTEVRNELGAPDAIEPGSQCWTYRGRTRNEATGQVDYSARFQYMDDRVIAILQYEDAPPAPPAPPALRRVQ